MFHTSCFLTGQLGDDSNKSSTTPVAAQGLPADLNGTYIAAGFGHTVSRSARSPECLLIIVRLRLRSVHYRLNVNDHKRRLVLVRRSNRRDCCAYYSFQRGLNDKGEFSFV